MNRRVFIGACLLVLILLASSLSIHTMAAPQAQLTVFPTPTPGPDGRIIYIAQKDDSVWRIAAISGITAEQFRKLNPFIVNDIIIPGQSYLIGYAGPVGAVPTAGPLPTQPIL